jgi:eukaryotic-like serine/threonine-protein kinase
MADLRFLSDEWPAISRRLDEAMAVEAQRRSTWLDALAEPDSIKDKLRRLLFDAAGVETDDFLGTLPKLTLGPAAAIPGLGTEALSAGAVIGPYRLARELGVGGMGAVWLAERVDGGLKRPVALKLPHLNWSSGLAERMSRERDILASLDHPNIARLYDAGLDEHGRPYLALEYVEGETIDAYCAHRKLSVPDRLRLVLQVARAVAHAHARLVVHRDLKPANILVTAQGEVRLLDFGIAKLMEGALTHDTQLTRQGGRAMTPNYASPEQIRGEPLGTASDVYSLGVVTYQLLAGVSPYTLKRQSAAALEEAIASIDPPRASMACADKAVGKQLKGDLDAVLNKALKKDPAERYATVEALIADIENHLSDRPVQAQPDRFGYRASKFLRRHRWPVAAGSAAALALMVSVSVALWQAHAASKQRDRALALLSRNGAITEFLELFVTEAAESDRPMKLGEMLDRSEAMADKQFKNEPEDRAVVLAMLGNYQESIQEVTKAEALVKRAIESARDSNDASLKARLACQYASLQLALGKVDEARRELLANVYRSDIDAEAASQCFASLADVSRTVNDAQGAVENSKRSLEKLKATNRAAPAAVAARTSELAYSLHLSGHNDEADKAFASSVQLYAELGREASPAAIIVRNNWGHVSLGSGNAKVALARYDEIMALFAKSGGGEVPPYLLSNRGAALMLAGRYADAAEPYKLALAAEVKSGHTVMQAYCLLGLGSSAFESGELQQAQAYLQQVEKMGSSTRPKGGPEAAAEHMLRGRLALSRADLPLARREFSAVVDERKPHATTVNALTARAGLALREGRLALASADAKDALQLAQSLQGGTPWSVRTGLAWLVEGEIRARSGAAAAAHLAFTNAVDHLTQAADASHPALKRAQAMAAEGTPVSSR